MKRTSVASKLCVRCNRVLPLGDFYPNKAWAAQRYHDVWCKECVSRYCKDQETQKTYCYENNRKWEDKFWDSAQKKAQYLLSTDAEFIDPKTTQKRRKEIENRVAVRQFFSMMNLVQFYGYVENVGEDGKFIPEDREPEQGSGSGRTYNKKWGGTFTEEEIDRLEDIYSQYDEDFVQDNVSMRDYARKVAKASLNADIAEDKFRRGEISAGEYKEAQKIFDDLSKSSNFAACRRKPGEASGMGSLGEIITRLEVSGKQKTNGFHFPEDDVDKIIADFRYTLKSVGIEG